MGFFDKTRYLRTLLILLPIGIFTFYYGIKTLSEDIDNLSKATGIVKKGILRICIIKIVIVIF